MYVDHLLKSGVQGAFICGSNGEGPSLTESERKAVAEAWVKAARGRLKIFVHVGHPTIKVAQSLTEHAAQIGADAASAVSAFYFKPDSVETLIEAMAAIASAAPSLPFYYYHIPALTSVSLDMVRFLELAPARIGSLAGIKYTATTLWEYQACLNASQAGHEILFGLDEMLLPAAAVGAKGAIGSTYSFAAPLYRQVLDAYDCGDMPTAQKLMGRLVEMVRILLKFPPIPAQKAIMQELGIPCGGCRLPLRTLSAPEVSALRSDLDKIGFWRDLAAAAELA